MSPNANDNTPIITLANYEEYFLMYVDEELTAQEKAMVDAFVQFHPDLQAELDLLLGTRLQPGSMQFGSLENLLSDHMRSSITDESLLLHVDGELDEAEKEAVEKKLATDETYREQHQLLLRTKSNPAELIPYPNKEELYRHTEHRMRFGFALRVAAAVLLVASMGLLLLQQQNVWQTGTASVASRKPATTSTGVTAAPADAGSSVAKTNAAVTNTAADPEKTPAQEQAALFVASVNEPKVKTASDAIATETRQVAEETTAQVPAADRMLAYEQVSLPQMDNAEVKPIPSEKRGIMPEVTATEIPVTSVDAAPVFADNRERGNIKSLLRKATRLVERRTGINTTNDDEELLIGVVALKLK